MTAPRITTQGRDFSRYDRDNRARELRDMPMASEPRLWVEGVIVGLIGLTLIVGMIAL